MAFKNSRHINWNLLEPRPVYRMVSLPPTELSMLSHSSLASRVLATKLLPLTGLYTWPYPCKRHYPSTTSPLPFPPTCNSLSFHLHIQGGHLHSIFHLFLSLLLLKSDDNVMEHHQHCISESISHCSQPTEALNQCTCIFIVAISKNCAEVWNLQKPRIITTYTLYILH